uniref:EF-hand domain-containing protein n=1 Tax=Euplotes harpa TaxID=151035 RepID=A0A7S3N7F6_9SPIT|mmetsp:Transcript_1938/g.2435  ORF Transcript_1938/g.2435 Transcript_1938/m.2435 type:complete len:205 (+) Transcript_1938:802-1416(+)
MVSFDTCRRFSALEALKSEWFEIVRSNSSVSEEVVLNEDVMNALENFSTDSIFEKAILSKLGKLVDPSELQEIKDTFNKIDSDHNGFIAFRELKKAFKSTKSKYEDNDIIDIIKEVDSTGNLIIDLNDFIAATLDRTKYCSSEYAEKLFNHIDLNGDGKIDENDIQREFTNFSREQIKEIMKIHSCHKQGFMTLNVFKKIIQNH